MVAGWMWNWLSCSPYANASSLASLASLSRTSLSVAWGRLDASVASGRNRAGTRLAVRADVGLEAHILAGRAGLAPTWCWVSTCSSRSLRVPEAEFGTFACSGPCRYQHTESKPPSCVLQRISWDTVAWCCVGCWCEGWWSRNLAVPVG